jgi:hypothetical protein
MKKHFICILATCLDSLSSFNFPWWKRIYKLLLQVLRWNSRSSIVYLNQGCSKSIDRLREWWPNMALSDPLFSAIFIHPFAFVIIPNNDNANEYFYMIVIFEFVFVEDKLKLLKCLTTKTSLIFLTNYVNSH